MSEPIDRVSSPISTLEVSLSFDDVLLLPGHSSVLPSECDVSTKLSRLKLRIPMMSSAMDTVTEAQTAIAMALMGGIGVLHRNCTAEQQAKMVRRVKKFQHAVIASPITVKPSQTIGEVHQLIEETGITGFPVVDENGVLVGMCTGRDIRYVVTPQTRVGEIMSTPALSLPLGATRLEAEDFFRRYKLEKLPLVDAQGRLGGLITSRDWRESKSHPDAVRDEQGSLMVAAAIGVGDEALERAAAQVEAGVDMLVVDSAHGHSDGVLRTVSAIKRRFPSLLLSGGNIATAEGAIALAEAGVDIVKVGMGPGSICTTRVVSGVGVAQFSAVLEVTRALRSAFPQVAIVADGGIRYSGDIIKALAAGADCVMLGGLFAGTEEAPGEVVLYQGRSYKSYRGMGSLGAMQAGSKDRYFQDTENAAEKLVPEGIEGRVPYKGPVASVVHQLEGGIRSGMGYCGCATLAELHARAEFVQITGAGIRESHVHDVQITKEAPNYHAD